MADGLLWMLLVWQRAQPWRSCYPAWAVYRQCEVCVYECNRGDEYQLLRSLCEHGLRPHMSLVRGSMVRGDGSHKRCVEEVGRECRSGTRPAFSFSRCRRACSVRTSHISVAAADGTQIASGATERWAKQMPSVPTALPSSRNSTVHSSWLFIRGISCS